MPETADQLTEVLRRQIEPGTRDKLVAKGLARGMIWANGVLPEGSPHFKTDLTDDLLDHGFSILSRACRLKDLGGESTVVESAFRVAAEAIESAVRRGDAADDARGFYLVSAASAFHIAHFAARAYSLLAGPLAKLNLSTTEQLLLLLIRRDFSRLRQICFLWRNDPANSDDAVTERLRAVPDYLPEDVVSLALTAHFVSAIATFDAALAFGDNDRHRRAIELLSEGASFAADFHLVPAWWIFTLARHLIAELWDYSLHSNLPVLPGTGEGASWNELRSKFIRMLRSRPLGEVDLWPSQMEAAIRAVVPSDDLIVALPTSAGKTRIAELCILRCLAGGRRIVYVTPLRALSAQVERTLARSFRPIGVTVTSLYGASGVAVADIDALAKNQIVVATPEKLDFAIRQQPSLIDDVGLVVLDEGHMIGLGTREVRYEVLVQRLLKRPDADQRRLVCLSAIFKTGSTFSSFVEWLRSDEPGTPISNSWRPTRQRPGIVTWRTGGYARLTVLVDGEQPWVPRFLRAKDPIKPRKTPFPRTAAELIVACANEFADQGHAVLIYCPTRRSVETQAKLFRTVQKQQMIPNRLADQEKIARAITVGREWLGPDHIALQVLRSGIAVHHGGLPRQFLSEIEALLNMRKDNPLPITIASPTLAQGLDLSCSAMVFQSLYRNGRRIPPQEYSNVIGRVGRAFVDIDGLSVLPIFETGYNGQRRLNDYNELRREAQTREMESGIILLIDELASRLASLLGVNPALLLEYVANHGGSFGPILANALESEAAAEHSEDEGDEDDDERDQGVPLRVLVDDLDAALLSTIEELDCQIDKLAGALDDALRSSLWSRRLGVRSVSERKLQRQILVDRATWIWAHSNPAQRRGFFSAGIGLQGGSFLANAISALVPQLLQAEIAFAEGEVDEVIAPLGEIIGVMLKVPPFQLKDVPHNWDTLVDGWLRGTPLGELVPDANSKSFAFVQDGLVYSMVWAVEAIRVFAVAVGALTGDELHGRCALALTYGLPSVNAALLLQAGLPSRAMAMAVDTIFPDPSASVARFRRWLDRVIAELDPIQQWSDLGRRQIWADFVRDWNETGIAVWESFTLTIAVSKELTKEHAGETVRLLPGQKPGDLIVADIDFRALTTISDPRAQLLSGYGLGHVEHSGLRVDYFGPPFGSAI